MKFSIVVVLSTILCLTIAKSVQKRDLRDDVIKRATALETRANALIKKLKADNKPSLVAEIQIEENRVRELAKELTAEKGPEAIQLLENELNRVEIRLNNEYRALETSDETRLRLTDISEKLEMQLGAEIKKFGAKGEAFLATSLIQQRNELESLSQRLLQAHTKESILVLENQLRSLETVVQRELNRLHSNASTAKPATDKTGSTTQASAKSTAKLTSPPSGQTKSTSSGTTLSVLEATKLRLVENAARLDALIDTEIKKLQVADQQFLVATLKEQKTELKSLSAQIMEKQTITNIQRLEIELGTLENFVQAELKRLDPNLPSLTTPK